MAWALARNSSTPSEPFVKLHVAQHGTLLLGL
jgi:hypothetical protein